MSPGAAVTLMRTLSWLSSTVTRDGVGLVDERPGEMVDDGTGAVVLGEVAHLEPFAAVKSSQAPEIFSSFSTRSVGWAPVLEPLDGLLVVDGDLRGLVARLVGADDLDELTVAGRAGVSGDDSVGGLLLLAHPHETESDGHVLSLLLSRRRRHG